MYVRRLEDDPNLDKKVQTTLPRMSFEMANMTYDASRKQNTNIKQFAHTPSGVISQYNPVPYNFDFNLYLYVRNIEDGTQIIEHILPYFTPDYTIKLNLIPEMGIVKEIPVVLNSATHEIDYEGEGRSVETRMIIWTLNFTVKGFVFGKVSDVGGLIRTSITNILNNITTDDVVEFNMLAHEESSYEQAYKESEIVYQGYSPENSTATAKVLSWRNGILKLTNIEGNFVSNSPIVGFISNANYIFGSYNILPQTQAQVVVVTNPTDATVNTSYTYTTTTTEIPNIVTPVISANTLAVDLNTNVFGIDDLNIELENQIDLGS
jgi:hypothetical protein